ncbi:Fujikurins efflux protein [Lachnellula cervina]|uniref:Fujikurins efflux protein n=1 Tax=Lachnellula cervina TaxID=1316786 RepID=A0A7D8UXN9_9HELO|nr:Fujikurins efflux protein [Lachnellula cervina]
MTSEQMLEVVDMKLDEQQRTLYDPVISSFPEGGLLAWLAVTGSFLTLFVASGFTYGYGVFLSYYSMNLLKDNTVSQIAWIGSSAPFIHSVIGIPVGKLYDDGYFRHLMIGGSLLHVISLMLLSLCTKYYQVFLCQGLLIGLATGLIYQPSIAILGHYFERRRSLAMGISASGAALGGVVFPILLNNLFEKYGFATGTREAAAMIFGLLVIANLAMIPRLPNRQTAALEPHQTEIMTVDQPKDIPKINWRKFFDPVYVIATFGAAFCMMGISFPFSYLQVFAEKHKAIDSDFAFYVLSIMMSASVFGAPFFAWLADFVGVFNIVIPTITVCAGLQFSLLGATSKGAVIAIGLFYGFFSAAFQAMLGPIFSRLSFNVTEMGQRMGIGFFLLGIGSLIGSPIEGALLGSDYIWWRPILFSVVIVTFDWGFSHGCGQTAVASSSQDT